MIDKIWYKMLDIKFGEIYLKKYLTLQKSLRKIFQIMILIVSSSGILGWKFFEKYAWVAFLLISIMQVFLLIKNQLVFSEKEMGQLAKLRMLYASYNNKLEKVWSEYYRRKTDEDEALSVFFDYREKDRAEILSLQSKLDIRHVNWLIKQTNNEIEIYLRKYHNYE